jgi:hypothetical protein
VPSSLGSSIQDPIFGRIIIPYHCDEAVPDWTLDPADGDTASPVTQCHVPKTLILQH